MVGLTNLYESEGFDRTHLHLPANHTELIKRITKVHDNVIVALSNGAPVAMLWKDQVKGIIEQYLGGQASGEALADVVFGKVNPSGKLAETFPNNVDEFPSNQHFPGEPRQVQYREGLYVGYRAYDSMKVDPLYPFGYGLSYTTFAYSNVEISYKNYTVSITCDITNTGTRDGKEIVQVYVSKPDSLIYRPAQELKAFDKVFVKAGETVQTTIFIPIDRLGVYNDSSFKLEAGQYVIRIGSSSRDIHHSRDITIPSTDVIVPDQIDSYKTITKDFAPTKEQFETLYGSSIPTIEPLKPFHINSTIRELSHTFIGKQLKKMITKQMQEMIGETPDEAFALMAETMADEMPLRSLVVLSNGVLSIKRATGLLDLANKKPLRGLWKIITG
jgi:beta-glucosidase